ncbi:hypothetical protein GCM10011515_08850 [Tsuneonella deserti]|uniref:Uncharacterized protein n=1 Tax=Tsuneonella deserti TaxID=2035528 RepID=A0ABQ1S2U6_9SPHN|nr:hypothetical protein GCM10011515_08850 [Tsuneonella deserti]
MLRAEALSLGSRGAVPLLSRGPGRLQSTAVPATPIGLQVLARFQTGPQTGAVASGWGADHPGGVGESQKNYCSPEAVQQEQKRNDSKSQIAL